MRNKLQDGEKLPARKRCGITGERCKWAASCGWNLEARERCGIRDVDEGFAKINVCTTAIDNGITVCRICPKRRRCGKVWRCFRAETKEGRR